jgi:hypothetical protein
MKDRGHIARRIPQALSRQFLCRRPVRDGRRMSATENYFTNPLLQLLVRFRIIAARLDG